jgi:hypothetical protein
MLEANMVNSCLTVLEEAKWLSQAVPPDAACSEKGKIHSMTPPPFSFLQRFQRCEYANVKPCKTEGRGWGLYAQEDIKVSNQAANPRLSLEAPQEPIKLRSSLRSDGVNEILGHCGFLVQRGVLSHRVKVGLRVGDQFHTDSKCINTALV